mgnify:CR=1 FL=1
MNQNQTLTLFMCITALILAVVLGMSGCASSRRYRADMEIIERNFRAVVELEKEEMKVILQMRTAIDALEKEKP